MGLDTLPDYEQAGHQAWVRECVALAQSLNAPAGQTGALGFLLPDQEFAKLTGGASFTPLGRPLPDEEHYGTLKKAFDHEQQAHAALRKAIFASVPPRILEHAPGYDPEYGVLRLDLRVLWDTLRARAAFASHTVYEKALAALAVPYVMGASVEDFLHTHAALHRECTRIGYSLNQGDKLRFLIGGLGGYQGPFATTLAIWESKTGRHPKRRTFEDGGKQEPLPPLTPPPDPKQTKAKAKAVAAAPPSEAPEYEGLATIVRRAALQFPPAAMATAASYGAHVPEPQQLTMAATVAHVVKKTDQWCWTHGKGTHSGEECRKRAKGHRPDATAARPMGGPAPRASR